MAIVSASIDLPFLNAVLAKVKASGQAAFEKTISVPFWPDPKIKVTVNFAVSNVTAGIKDGRLQLSAKVNVRVPPPLQLSYTADAKSDVAVRLAVPEVIFSAKSLVVPVYAKPGGHRVDLGKVDICSLLHRPIEASVKALPESYARSLPESLGGASVAIDVLDPRVTVQPTTIDVSATLSVRK